MDDFFDDIELPTLEGHDSDSDEAFFDFESSDDSDEEDTYTPQPISFPRKPQHPFTLGYTEAMRQGLGAVDPSDKVADTLYFMNQSGLNLEIFLDALFWGTPGSISHPKIQSERTTFMASPSLGRVLNRMLHPPGSMARSGHDTLREFVIAGTQEVLLAEMKAVSRTLRAPENAVNKEYLTSINLRAVGDELRDTAAPILWQLLRALASRPRQRKENTVKDSFHIILTIMTILAYSRSHRNSAMTMLWSIYLKACGLSARAFDALHALGITMSHRWTAYAFERLSTNAMDAVRTAIRRFSWAITHDNLNMPLRVFSQRIHNQTHFISASAATVWTFPESIKLPPDINQQYQQQRREAGQQPFDRLDLLVGDPAVDARLRAHSIYQILRFLLDSPAFRGYPHKDHLDLMPPSSELLVCSPEDTVQQHVLQTVDIDESSYEGTNRLINEEYPKQLGLSSLEEQRRTGAVRIVPWIGDQLTVERERGMIKYLHDEPNSWLRMDWVVPIFGWFHLLMAVANSLHAQYLGTSRGIGLRKAFDLLGRKSLLTPSTKGVFWHHLEALYLSSWNHVGRVDDLKKLRDRSPSELKRLAERIYTQHASRTAMEAMQQLSEDERDEVALQAIMFRTDMLTYLGLRHAMRIGNVQHMEDLLPTLLFRFAGGKNPKYTIEVLELLQCLKREWPKDLSDHVRKHCWLMNRTGKPDGWTAFDQGQEQNIKDIKVTWHSFGPGASFEYIRKVSPAIPALRAIKNSVASQFSTLTGRGNKHKKPDKDGDIEVLRETYNTLNLHAIQLGRKFHSSDDRASDFVTAGASDLLSASGGAFERWWANRSFDRATRELWPEVRVDGMVVDE